MIIKQISGIYLFQCSALLGALLRRTRVEFQIFFFFSMHVICPPVMENAVVDLASDKCDM